MAAFRNGSPTPKKPVISPSQTDANSIISPGLIRLCVSPGWTDNSASVREIIIFVVLIYGPAYTAVLLGGHFFVPAYFLIHVIPKQGLI